LSVYYTVLCELRVIITAMLCFVFAACVVDLAFVIDNSGSIRDNDPPGGNNWQLILDFVKSIVNELIIAPYATRVAVVDFGMYA